MDIPVFPHFKPIAVEDRAFIHPILRAFGPETSELTFTNLFIWRGRQRIRWAARGDCLVAIAEDADGPYGLPPVGPGPRREAAADLIAWLRDSAKAPRPRIARADRRLADELSGDAGFSVVPERDHFDYVYRRADLAELPGRAYHSKRNHIERFARERTFSYLELSPETAPGCRTLQQTWCRIRRCEEEIGLMDEWDAILEAINEFGRLGLTGGAIVVEGRIEAFSFGEMLDDTTAVVHIEKANPEIPGLYPLVNREFAGRAWAGAEFINREQDLGDEGLRRAKLSWHPARLVEKFAVTAADGKDHGAPV